MCNWYWIEVNAIFHIFLLLLFFFSLGDSCAVNDGKTCGDCIKVDGVRFLLYGQKCNSIELTTPRKLRGYLHESKLVVYSVAGKFECQKKSNINLCKQICSL